MQQTNLKKVSSPKAPLTYPCHYPIPSLFHIKKQNMKKVTIKPFMVIGIAVRTSNIDEQSAQDIGQLWGKFMSEGTAGQIPNKVSEEILSIYTNYEGDHMKPYDTILGCKVDSLDTIPEGMVGQSFDGGTYGKYVCKGDLTQGAVWGTWSEIFEEKIDRVFTADFEVYGEKAQNPSDAEVDVLVAIK